MSCVCTCLSTTNKVRIIVFIDLMLALAHTIYRVTTLSLDLKQVFGLENGKINNAKYANSSLEQITIKKFSSVFLITAAVVGLSIEIFLFFLLNNGARSKNYRHCKHWLVIRLVLLGVGILGSLIEYARDEYTLINGIMEAEKLYRLITLFVVRCFIKEIYKGINDNQFEHASSIADGYPFGIPSINNMRSQSHSHIVF